MLAGLASELFYQGQLTSGISEQVGTAYQTLSYCHLL